jgi:hypothetical protein
MKVCAENPQQTKVGEEKLNLHERVLRLFEQWVNKNRIFVYNDFQSVEDVICRRIFVEKYNALTLQHPQLYSQFHISIPPTEFIEKD